ncbi:MAG: hypothetical protein HY470_00400 [Candidatus Ryanbacteria bacterium]|nr:hypothetical protein [Candidatus Ryanbacteria bacterium]
MAMLNQTFEKFMRLFLDELPARSRSILKRRYGIGGQKPLTLEAIGQKEGITRERVRQIENDALRRLKKSPSFETLSEHTKAACDILNSRGGIVAEEQAVGLPEFKAVADKNLLLFFFDLSNGIQQLKADALFRARWHTKDAPVEKIEAALAAFVSELASHKKTITEDDAHSRLVEYLQKYNGAHATEDLARSYMALSHAVAKNTWGEVGHTDSPFVHPRGMREGAFVVLSRAGEPLHFREIALRIGDFLGKSAHLQTVHNELIKDPRFVLVGRGLYALGEWGYKPGFVRDVLVELLRTRGQMTRDEIVSEVASMRKVKPSTVAINLQNKKLFRALGNGAYTLVS